MIRRLIRRALGFYSPSLAAIGHEPDLTLARKAAARGDENAAACVLAADFAAGFAQGFADGMSVDIAGGVVGVRRLTRLTGTFKCRANGEIIDGGA